MNKASRDAGLICLWSLFRKPEYLCFPGNRTLESQFNGGELQATRRCRAIQPVSHNRVANAGQMASDLMFTSGFDSYLHLRCV